MEDFDAFDCVSNVFSELHSKREVLFPLTSMCLVCENSTLSVNNQCDVVVYGLSGSRSPRSVSPVEESTITPHVLGLWEFHSLCKQSMWCGCLRIEWIKVSTQCQSCRRIYNYSTCAWSVRIPLSVNNQCDVVIYGLSGSRSTRGVSPVEESTITLHITM